MSRALDAIDTAADRLGVDGFNQLANALGDARIRFAALLSASAEFLDAVDDGNDDEREFQAEKSLRAALKGAQA